jgi:hypothetical protein
VLLVFLVLDIAAIDTRHTAYSEPVSAAFRDHIAPVKRQRQCAKVEHFRVHLPIQTPL